MSGPFEIAEDELNFILDGDDAAGAGRAGSASVIHKIFGVDDVLHDANDLPVLPPLSRQWGRDPCAPAPGAASSNGMLPESFADGEGECFISRLCSLSPSPRPSYEEVATDPVTPNDGDLDELINDAFGIISVDPTSTQTNAPSLQLPDSPDGDSGKGGGSDGEELDDFNVMDFDFDIADELLGCEEEEQRIMQQAPVQPQPDHDDELEEKSERPRVASEDADEPEEEKKWPASSVFDLTQPPDVITPERVKKRKVRAPIIHAGNARRLPLRRRAVTEEDAIVHEDPGKFLDIVEEEESMERRRVEECDEEMVFILEGQAKGSQEDMASQDAVADPKEYEPMGPQEAAKARMARSNRRLRRAKYQAINMVGNGKVAEVKRIAVLSLDLSRLRPKPEKSRARLSKKGKKSRTKAPAEDTFDVAKVERALLADFMAHFSPEEFVARTFQHAYQNMVAATKKTEELAALEAATSDTDYAMGLLLAIGSEGPGAKITKGKVRAVPLPPQKVRAGVNAKDLASGNDKPRNAASDRYGPPEAKENAEGAKVVTGNKAKEKAPKTCKEALKMLPSGKDPESRRLRRLMRNRLSAQASRDRKKAALEEQRRIKRAKEAEIKRLREEVAEETQRTILLERAVAYARTYLGPDHYARIAGKAGVVGQAADIGLVCKAGAIM